MKPRRSGVREVKAHLSRLLREVQRGQEWVITERGKPVAKLVPVVESDIPLAEHIRHLESAGLVEPLNREARDLPPPLPLKKGLAQKWLQEDRNG